nr:class V chitinase-like [Ziziphus jujuba var. spinosa]
MGSKIIVILFQNFLSLVLEHSRAQSWIQAGYRFHGSEFPISNINSALFTHLICSFAEVKSSTYELSFPSSHEQQFSSFTAIVSLKNPSISTLFQLGLRRKSFHDSSIKAARLYGFQGLDFPWGNASTTTDMTNKGTLFEEWRAAVNSEARNSSHAQLILTAAVKSSPDVGGIASLPVESILRNLDWIRGMPYGYHSPKENLTGAYAAYVALHNPSSQSIIKYSFN